MKYLILLAVAFFGAATASVEFDTPCRLAEVSPRVKTGFQIAAYLGTWYEERRYEAANQTDFDCVMARYTLNTDGSVRVGNSGYAPGGTFIEFVGNAVPAFPDQDPLPAKLSVFFVEGQPISIYWVLSTDYVNYAVVWSCAELAGGRSREQAWILSRTPELNAAAAARVNEVVALNNLVPAAFRQTNQDLAFCRSPIPV